MSDALTNSEIEDVLTSVRRLVADDKHRPHPTETRGGNGGRLILTQSQRVDTSDAALGPAARSTGPSNVIETAGGDNPTKAALMPEAPDFRRLEATIAELEAAVSASGSVFEPDGSEAAPASNVTALYAKPSFQHAFSSANDASQIAPERPAPSPAPPPAPTADDLDEDDADSLNDDEIFEAVIDEATLRTLVAQIVREELQGQLGERITLQVRKLVRSEIAKALDSRRLL